MNEYVTIIIRVIVVLVCYLLFKRCISFIRGATRNPGRCGRCGKENIWRDDYSVGYCCATVDERLAAFEIDQKHAESAIPVEVTVVRVHEDGTTE